MTTRARCVVDGCARFAASDSSRCTAHARATPETPPAPPPKAGLNVWLEAGIAGDVSASGEGDDLAGELGALRYALAQAITGIDDPVKLANAVAKIAGATAQIARARRAISGQQADAVTDAIESILTELSEVGR